MDELLLDWGTIFYIYKQLQGGGGGGVRIVI